MKTKLLPILFTVLLISCNSSEDNGIEFIPFQETDGGQWSMISPSGEILFTEEFKNTPTVVKEGRFMVKNENDLWEIYTAEKKPQKIGSEYAYASLFSNGKALVAERNGYVQIIDKEGNILKKLDKLGNKVIDAVGNFSEGYAVYQTGDMYGVIDDEGKEIIKADYLILYPCSDGKFIGLNKKYEKEFNSNKEKKKLVYDVIDNKGKVLFNINSEKYSNTGTRFIDGLLTIAVNKDDKECWGLINDKNEVVIKPSDKIKGITDIKGQHFVYTNGEGYGVMNLKGENVIRAKYDFLYFDGSDRLVAIIEKTKNSKDYECKYIDIEDNQIGEDKYVSINPFSQFDGNYSFVKVSDRIWSIVDLKGKQVEKLPDIVNINLGGGDNEILCDHIDFNMLFNEMNLSANTVDSVGIGKTTPWQAVKLYTKAYSMKGSKEHPADDPYWFDYKSNLDYFKSFSKVFVGIVVGFPQNLSRRTYRTDRIKYWEDDYYNYYYNKRTPTGYAFNNTKANVLMITFTNTGKMKGKLNLALKELKARFKKYGTVVKENNGAAVISIDEKNRAKIYMTEDAVSVIWGDIKPVDKLDIDEYKDIKEKIKIDESIIQTVNGMGRPILLDKDADEIDTDSVEVVDSAEVN